MDELALKTTKVKTQVLKLNQALKGNDDLKSKINLRGRGVGDVYCILLHLQGAHDSVLTISVRRHLAENLRPALDILSRIEGILETVFPSKQGGEDASQGQPQKPLINKPISQPKVTVEPKGNEALGSMNDKRKKKNGDDDEVEIEDVVETEEKASKTKDLKIK